MKRPFLLFTGVVFPILANLALTSSFAQVNCSCEIPFLPASRPRYPPGSTVTVYMNTTNINTASGFSLAEIEAIEAGIGDWNGQPNNANITYVFVRTPNPPSLPPTHAVIANFSAPVDPDAVAETQAFSHGPGSGTVVYNVMTFHGSIRLGLDLFAYVRAVARHETAHTLGLNNSTCPGSITNDSALTSSSNISDCDNNRINEDVFYSPSTCPSCPWADVSECPSNCVSAIDWCLYPSYGCPPVIGVMKDGACWCYRPSPVVIDVLGNGFNLTDAENGVDFDINGNGTWERISWTAVGDDAWLAIDLNGNGLIDNGTEVFGTFSPQPAPPAGEEKNGFLALAEYDKLTAGGNLDGLITASDAAFAQLRLWQDLNHNGVSEPSELHTLSEFGLATLELNYKESKKTDEHGNQLRYRAKVKDAHGRQIGRWAWDVFLLGQQ